MANISSLAVQLTAKIGGFQSGIARAGKTLNQFSAGPVALMGKAVRSVNGAMAGLGAGVSFGAFVYGVRNAATALDELAKSADKLGASTEGLRAMQYAGKLAGVEVNTLTMGIQRMTRRIAEAAIGTGEARGALKELGLDAVALARARPEQQFAAIAGRLQRVASAGDKVRLAFKLFDSEGVDLLRITPQALAQAAIETELFGTAINRLDASKVEQMHDAFTRVREALTGMFTQVAVKIAPAITDLTNRVAAWAAEGGGVAVKVAGAFDILGTQITAVTRRFEIMFRIVKTGALASAYILGKAFVETFILLDKGIVAFQNKVNDLLGAVGLGALFDTSASLPVEEMRKWVDGLKTKADASAGELIETIMSPPDESQFAKRLQAWWDGVQTKANLAESAIAPSFDNVPLAEVAKDVKGKTDDARKSAEKLAKALQTGSALSGTAGTIAVNRREGVSSVDVAARTVGASGVTGGSWGPELVQIGRQILMGQQRPVALEA